MVRIGTPFPDDIADAIVYNIEDQIGSSTIRLNNIGGIIDKEEYYPFGDSSFRTFAKKRYRYVGKEKDLESGLYYYGARYYAAWTCRFISVDPLASDYPFYTPYNYAGNKPIGKVDIDGMQEDGAETAPVKSEEAKTIHFIDSYSGKFLGSKGDENANNYEVRSITKGEFSELKENEFNPIEITETISITVEDNSTLISIDQDKIIADLQTISQDKKINEKIVEQNMYIIFDKTENKITSYVLPYDKNTNLVSQNPSDDYGTHRTVQGDRTKVILGQVHSHPDLHKQKDNTIMSGASFNFGKQDVNAPGVSRLDKKIAVEYKIPIYALATYKGKGGNDSIYKVDSSGISYNNNGELTNLTNVIQKNFDLIRNNIRSNK